METRIVDYDRLPLLSGISAKIGNSIWSRRCPMAIRLLLFWSATTVSGSWLNRNGIWQNESKDTMSSFCLECMFAHMYARFIEIYLLSVVCMYYNFGINNAAVKI